MPILETHSGKALDASAEGYWANRTWENLCALFGTLALAGAAGITQQFLTQDKTDLWPRTRSVSEALKSEIYRLRAEAHPYKKPSADQSDAALPIFRVKTQESENPAEDIMKDLSDAPASPGPPPANMIRTPT